MSRLVLLSDIHANLSALKAVIEDFTLRYEPDTLCILGDIVNYGMRPNEVIEELRKIQIPVIVNLYGNHERALIGKDIDKFSTERGKALLKYTKENLNQESLRYISEEMMPEGQNVIEIDGKKILFIHGSLGDPYWGKLNCQTIDDTYSAYDYVLSGHSHVPHLLEKFFDSENPDYRNKKRTIFINPGSVGQPRNHNPRAQYAYIDLEKEIFHFNAVDYDVKTEQNLFPSFLDQFYKKRLTNGI